MKIHLNIRIYDTFYIMKKINYLLNNPLETRKAHNTDISIRRMWDKPKVSRNSIIKLILL